MEYLGKEKLAAILVGLFGLFLIWQGITGHVAKKIDGKAIIPRWVYILAGLVVLILPLSFLIVLLRIG